MGVGGAGVIGTMHAVAARGAGWAVTHPHRDVEPRAASVRNFGLVWVSGRAEGDELAVALRARELWEHLGRRAPGVGFRPDGSMTIAQRPEEVAVLEQVAARADATERDFHLLEPDEVRAVNPAIRGDLLAGLHCGLDGVVEPRHALPALRDLLAREDAGDGYRFCGGRTVTALQAGL